MNSKIAIHAILLLGFILNLMGCAPCKSTCAQQNMNPEIQRPGSACVSSEQYFDKVQGAWLGKCIGGALGMPIESWSSDAIFNKYGRLTDYIGYFDEIVMNTTEPVSQAQVPADQQWHTITLEATVPDYDSTKYHACPAIGIAIGKREQDSAVEMRNLTITGGPQFPALMNEQWQGYFVNVTAEGMALFEYKNYFDSQWVRLTAKQTKNFCLQPGTRLSITCDVRAVSGDPRLMVAFDHVLTGPRPGFGPDDDTMYQIVGLLALEKYGPDLSAKQIGKQWTDSLGFISPLLAEGLALERLRNGIEPPQSGVHSMNEAIGGQIKAEIWGLVCPGRPDLAAEYARRDGLVAHANNGVYGEQFVAAIVAQAFCESDPAALVQTGLQYIPQDSQYAQVVRNVVEQHAAGVGYQEILKELVAKYPTPCDPVFGDAGIITLGLLYGECDFEKTLLLTASCGQDTDCDAATVAAILGCIKGAKALPPKWRDPIADEFRSQVKGQETLSIEELSRRICVMGSKVQAYHGAGMKFSSEY